MQRSQKGNRKQETPVFERLEPRLLLNADMTGLTDGQNLIVPVTTEQTNNAIEVDLNQTNSLSVTSYTPQSLPYTQDFSGGKPTASQGWEYYSTNQGQINVVGGKLRLDDSVDDWSYSLNEAILHVDLTGKTNVTLTLDHTSIADENQALLSTFSGHYKGDGIALSVDGVNWVTITNLTTSFTGQSFNLDAIIAQAKTLASSTDVSDVRIKFQQYDNSYSPYDGREFDNIQITAV